MAFDYSFLCVGANDKKKLKLKSSIEIPENESDIFISLFDFDKTALEYYQQTKGMGGFHGIMYIDFFPFDIDSDSLDKSCKLTQRLIRELRNKGINNFKLSFSGKKGFHVIVDADYFGGFDPSERLPEQLLALGKQLTSVEFDESIYSRLRLFRVTNTKHNISGLYKVQIDEEMLNHPDKIREYAKQPQPVFTLQNTIPNHSLIELKKRCFSLVPKTYNFSNDSPVQKEMCVQKMFEGVNTGERNNVLCVLTSHLRIKGLPEKIAYASLAEWNNSNTVQIDREEFDRTFKEMWNGKYTYGCWHYLKDKHCDKTCYLYQKKYTYDETKKDIEFYTLNQDAKKEYIKVLEQGGIQLGLSEEIDNRMRKLIPGDLWGLMGRPAAYKSTFAQMIGKHYVENYDGLCVLISLEMGLPRLYERQWGIEQDLSPNNVEETIKVINFDSKYDNFLFTVKKGLSVDEIEKSIKDLEFKTNKKVGLLMIDFFHALKETGNATEKAIKVMRRLKDVPHNLQCVCGILIHTSREGGGDGCVPLKLGSSRDTSAIEDNCDFLFGAHKVAEDNSLIRLQMLKNKNDIEMVAGVPFKRSSYSVHLTPVDLEYLPTEE